MTLYDVPDKQCCFSEESRLMFCHHFFPYKSIFVCGCLYFCSVNKYFRCRYLIEFMEHAGHLWQKILCAFREMFCSESCNCRMIGCRLSFEQIFVVDITPAAFLDCSGWDIFCFVIGVKHDLEHDFRRRVFFWRHSFVCVIKSSQIHFLHKLTNESYWIIFRYADIQFHWNF